MRSVFVFQQRQSQNMANNVAEGRGASRSADPASVRVWRGAEQRHQAAAADMGSHFWSTTHHQSQASRRPGTTKLYIFCIFYNYFWRGFVCGAHKECRLKPQPSGKLYSYIPTVSTSVVSPARPAQRSAVIIMHPDKYLPELVAEKNSLDPTFAHAVRLLAEGKSSIFNLPWCSATACKWKHHRTDLMWAYSKHSALDSSHLLCGSELDAAVRLQRRTFRSPPTFKYRNA